MKITHLLALALSLSTALVPMVQAEPEPLTPQQEQLPEQVQEELAAQWKSFLHAAIIAPGLSSQDEEELLRKLDTLITAAISAREAQLNYGLNSLALLSSQYQSARYTTWRKAMEQEYTQLVNSLFKLDMLAFAANFNFNTRFPIHLLTTDFPDMLPTEPGVEDFSQEPAICKALLEKPVSGSVPISDTARQGVELWEQHLRQARARLGSTYGLGENQDWELHNELFCKSEADTEDYEKLGELFSLMETSWETYYAAARAFAESCSPEYGSMGSAGPYSELMLRRCLLDSHSRLLCTITRTLDHEDTRARTPDCHQLHSPSTVYGFGRLHNTTALLFRHPRMEGSPWCIAFSHVGYCRSFLQVEDTPALRQLAKQHPQGGIFQLEGYHTVHVGGTPLLQAEEVPAETERFRDEIDTTRVRYPKAGRGSFRLFPAYHIRKATPAGKAE